MTPQALLSAKRNSVSLSLLAAVLLLSLIWIGLSFPRGFFRPTGYPPLGIFLQEPASGAGFLNRRAFQCSDAQRNGQAAAWRPLVDSRDVLLNCADSVYLNFVKEASHGRDLTLLNIGANKGYGLVQWLIEFDSTFNVTLEQVHSKYEELFPGVPRLCGVCQDCRETPHTVPLLPSVSGSLARDAVPANSKPTIFAFEPAENNRLVLEALSDLIQYPKLEVVQAAASNVSGEMYFTPCTPGQETCRLLTAYMEGAKTIEVTTVDKFLKERGVQHVDILKIDAEGFDPLVLQGARRTLSLRKVRVLEFEYHEINHWSSWGAESSSLEEVTAWLDSMGYDCYLQSSAKGKTESGDPKTESGLVRLTGCWDPRLEVRLWSNVACVLRDELELSMMFFKASRWL